MLYYWKGYNRDVSNTRGSHLVRREELKRLIPQCTSTQAQRLEVVLRSKGRIQVKTRTLVLRSKREVKLKDAHLLYHVQDI